MMISLSPTHELLAVMSDNNTSFYVRQSKFNMCGKIYRIVYIVFDMCYSILNCVVLCCV